MRAQRYIVLDPGPTVRATFDRAGKAGRQRPVRSPKVEEMTPAQVARQREQGRKLAPVLPMSLVRPVASAASAQRPQGSVTWGVEAVGATASTQTGAGVKVAVLDTGIDAHHEAFAGLNITQRDFTGEGDGDTEGHGTHCAGTIAGRDLDGYRFGVAQGLDELLVAKVLGQDGGATDALADAMIWALQEGAQVISMSLGVDFPGAVRNLVDDGLQVEPATSMALQQYRENLDLFGTIAQMLRANELVGRGALVVAATGNESMRDAGDPYTIDVAPPAASDGFVRVAALSPSGVAPFSNTGSTVAGPGVDVFSAAPGGGYELMSGTSMATPHVAGVAALWAERIKRSGGRPVLSELAARLEGSAVPPAGSERIDVGAGMVQAPR